MSLQAAEGISPVQEAGPECLSVHFSPFMLRDGCRWFCSAEAWLLYVASCERLFFPSYFLSVVFQPDDDTPAAFLRL